KVFTFKTTLEELNQLSPQEVHRLEELESELNVIINETQHKRKWSPEETSFRENPRVGSDVNTRVDHMTVATTGWPPIERQTHDMNEDINVSDDDIKPVLTPESDCISLSATQEMSSIDNTVDNVSIVKTSLVLSGNRVPEQQNRGNRLCLKFSKDFLRFRQIEMSSIDNTVDNVSIVKTSLVLSGNRVPEQQNRGNRLCLKFSKNFLRFRQLSAQKRKWCSDNVDLNDERNEDINAITLNEDMMSRDELAVTDSHNKTSLAIQSTTSHKPSVDNNKALRVKRVTVGTALVSQPTTTIEETIVSNSAIINPLAVNTVNTCKQYPTPQPYSTNPVTAEKTTLGLKKFCEQKFVCTHEGCGREFLRPRDRLFHIKYMHSFAAEDKSILKQFQCPHDDCDRVFKYEGLLQRHVDDGHSTREYRCDWPDCQFWTHTECLLDNHRLVHSEDKPFECQWPGCDYRAKTKYAMTFHVKHKHLSDPLACDWSECGRSFAFKTQLIKHMSVHKGLVPSVSQSLDKPFVCAHEECGQRFATKIQFNRHVTAAHPTDRPFACDFQNCGKRFKTRNALIIHKKVVHLTVGQQFRCPKPGCGRAFKTNLILRGHLNGVHSTREYRCDWPDCQYRTHTQPLLDMHRLIHSEDKPYACDWPACQYTGRSYAQLNAHKKTHEDNRPLACDWPECGLHFKTTLRLKEHMIVHKGLVPPVNQSADTSYVCAHEDCGQRFATKIQFNRHVTAAHPTDRPFTCDYENCGKRFKTRKTLMNHKREVHLTVGQQFRCPESGCGQAFKTKLILRAHLKNSHSTREYRCDWLDCQYRTHTQPLLDMHRLIHSEDKPYACDWPGCEQRTRTYGQINAHKKSHSDNGLLLACDWPGCEYTARTKSQIKIHQVIHSDDMPYVCDWPQCEYRGRSKRRLNAHKKIHDDNKPVACDWPACEYRCRTVDAMKSHRLIHTDERPHACDWPDCGKRFKSKNMLRDHVVVHTGPDMRCDVKGCEFKTRHRKVFTFKTTLEELNQLSPQEVHRLEELESELNVIINDKQHKRKWCPEDTPLRDNPRLGSDVTTRGVDVTVNSTGRPIKYETQTCDTNEEIVRPYDASVDDINLSDNEQNNSIVMSCESDTKPLITHHLMSGTDSTCNTICDQPFESNKDLGPHVRTHATDDHIQTLIATKSKFRFKCLAEECRKRFIVKTSLIEHMLNSHRIEDTYECKDCDAVCLTTDEIIRHRQREHVMKTFVCTRESCGESFSGQTALWQHIQDIHTTNDRQSVEMADNCDNEYSDYDGSDGVIAESDDCEHNDEYTAVSGGQSRDFKCDYNGCNMTFKRSPDLLRHRFTHSTDKPHKCPADGCGYQCIRRCELRIHLKRKHRNDKSLNQILGSDVTTSDHRVTDTSGGRSERSVDKRFKCTVNGCHYSGNSFHERNRHTITTHKSKNRIRSGDGSKRKNGKSFKCDYNGCHKSFKEGRHLERHRWTHSAVKPFKCTVNGCMYSTINESQLEGHINKHRGIRPFVCTREGCGKGYYIKRCLIRHTRIIHES
ncbi:unnamed protein product, partial [Medioppia subpectinata]